MFNKDEVEGKGKQVKGTVKEGVGKVIGNRSLQEEGQADQQEGEIEEGFGKARRKVGDAVKKVGKAISR
jgi:uncharacterized protein YjbJ (UPF0337 family)